MDNPGLCVSGGEVKVGSRARLMLAQFPLEKENTIYWFQGNDMCSQPCFPVLLLIRPGPSFSRVWTPSAFGKRPCQLLLQEVLNHESTVRGKICLLCLRGTGTWFNWVWLPSLSAEFCLWGWALPILQPHSGRYPAGNFLTLHLLILSRTDTNVNIILCPLIKYKSPPGTGRSTA